MINGDGRECWGAGAELGEDEVRQWVSGLKIWMKPRLSPTKGESEDRTRTHHSLPQDQALRGVSVDLQLNGLWRVIGTKKKTKKKTSMN